jgi:hypothetical protein
MPSDIIARVLCIVPCLSMIVCVASSPYCASFPWNSRSKTTPGEARELRPESEGCKEWRRVERIDSIYAARKSKCSSLNQRSSTSRRTVKTKSWRIQTKSQRPGGEMHYGWSCAWLWHTSTQISLECKLPSSNERTEAGEAGGDGGGERA